MQPLLIAPANNFETTNTSVLFTFAKGDHVLIDDNPEFSSPETLSGNQNVSIRLNPGTYYWKVEGILGSEIRQLTIKSSVALALRQASGGYEVINVGNVPLSVDVYDKGTLVGNVIVGMDGSENVSGDKFIGGENE